MLKDDFEKYYPVLKKILSFILVMALILVVFKLAFVFLLPFVFALLIALAMEPFIRLLARLRLQRGPAIVVAMVVYFGSLFALAYFAISRLISEVVDFSGRMPDFSRTFSAFFTDLVGMGR